MISRFIDESIREKLMILFCTQNFHKINLFCYQVSIRLLHVRKISFYFVQKKKLILWKIFFKCFYSLFLKNWKKNIYKKNYFDVK